MPKNLSLVAHVTDLPMTLPEAKSHLRYDGDDEDVNIHRILSGAATEASVECGIGFGVGSYTLTLDDFPACGGAIGIGVRPIVSAVVVTYVDDAGTTVTLDPAQYYVGAASGRIMPAAGWPTRTGVRPDSIVVTFAAGLTPAMIPNQARDAIKLILASRFEKRGDTDEVRETGIPVAARRLLWQLHSGIVF